MAIAKMLRMSLVGIDADEEELLNALHKTGAVQLKTAEDLPGTEKSVCDKSMITEKQDRLENALSVIWHYAKEKGKGVGVVPDGFGVSYADFMSVKKREGEILEAADKVRDLNENIVKNRAEIITLKNEAESYAPYLKMKEKFSDFISTSKTTSRLGTVPLKEANNLESVFGGMEYVHFETLAVSDRVSVVALVALNEKIQEADKILAEHGFSRCLFTSDEKAADKTAEINVKINNIGGENERLKTEILGFCEKTRDFKLLSDYLLFEKEKAFSSDGFGRTKRTFLLEAYVPEERREQIEKAVSSVSGSVYAEFSELNEDDYAPTLMRNKKVPAQFEFVTNMYSVPKYLSFDPNTVIAFFFSVFLGFITADAGYGILLAAGGFAFAFASKRKSGITKLANVIAWGGIATIVFGFLFDSFFGVPLLRNLGWIKKPVMPDPIKDSSDLAGISIPSLLLISLGMGVVHIMTALFINALCSFRHGKVFDGICDGFIWIAFLAGLFLLVLRMTGILPGATLTAACIMIASVVLGALTAGRHAKGFGKFTKGFGAVYGLINYASDILSYARLYGLMLSGAQIAEIVSVRLALPMLESPGGVTGIIVCALIMLVGHAFNIAMGVLGAFIHDARLQYVEFFAHFYEGDGDLFVPMGSKLEHVYICGPQTK